MDRVSGNNTAWENERMGRCSDHYQEAFGKNKISSEAKEHNVQKWYLEHSHPLNMTDTLKTEK